ncbi:unnamed protein product, partial [Laminaria digitata]
GRPPAALRGAITPAARVVRLPPLALRATDAGSLIDALVPVITDFGPDNRGYSPTIRGNVYVAVAAGTAAAAAGRRRRTAVGGAVVLRQRVEPTSILAHLLPGSSLLVPAGPVAGAPS